MSKTSENNGHCNRKTPFTNVNITDVLIASTNTGKMNSEKIINFMWEKFKVENKYLYICAKLLTVVHHFTKSFLTVHVRKKIILPKCFLVLLLLPPVSSDCFCSQYDIFADCRGTEACPIGKPIVTVQCWIRHIATDYQIQKLRIRGDCPLGEIYEKLCPNEYIQELHSIMYNSTRICQG